MAVSNVMSSIAAPFMRDAPASSAQLAVRAFLQRRHLAHTLLACPHAYVLVWLYSDVLRLATILLLPESDSAPSAPASSTAPPLPPPPPPPPLRGGAALLFRLLFAPWRAPYAAARGALACTPAAARSAWFLLPAAALTAALIAQPVLVAAPGAGGGGGPAARVLAHAAACAAGLHCAASAALLEAEDRARGAGGGGWRWRRLAAVGLGAAGALLFAAGSAGVMPEMERASAAPRADDTQLKRFLETGLDLMGSIAAPLELASTAAGVPLPVE
jgi:hypothetical protein